MASPESWCAGNGAVGSNPTPSAARRPEVPGPRRAARFVAAAPDPLVPVTPPGLFGAPTPTPPETPSDPKAEEKAPAAAPEAPEAETAPGTTGSPPTSAGPAPETTPEDPAPETTPEAAPADTAAATTPEGAAPEATPADTAAATPPQVAAPKATPADPAPEATRADAAPATTPEGSAPEATPDDAATEAAPEGAAPEATPADPAAETTPAEGAAPKATPDDAVTETTPEGAAREAAPDDAVAETTPESAAPEAAPADPVAEATSKSAAPETTPADPAAATTSETIPDDSESAAGPEPAAAETPNPERPAARSDDAGAGEAATDSPAASAAPESAIPAPGTDPVPPTAAEPAPEPASPEPVSAAGTAAAPEPPSPSPNEPPPDAVRPGEPASAGAAPETMSAAGIAPAPAVAAANGAAAEADGGGESEGSESEADEYEVLALRYRPQTFADLIGQEPIARTLQNAIRRDRVSHAFLFSGQRGIGKTTTARILAKALNCAATDGPNPEPCGGCPSCREIAGGFSRDVPEIDGASNNSVEKAREIIETAHYTPVRDRFKIYLVDEVHMLSTGAFNALLKTLEEPPKHVKFIFATTEVHKIPDTILSRCQEFEFRAVTPERVQERLRFIVEGQGFTVSDEALAQIARFGQGSMRDAISALDQVLAAVDGEVTGAEVSELLGVPDVTICRRAAAAILEGDRRAVFEVVADLVSGGRDLKHFVTLFMHYLRDVVVCRAAPDRPGLLEWPDERAALTDFAGKFSEEDLLRSLDVLTRAQDGLRWSPEPRFHLEMALLKLVEMPRLAAFETLLDRIENAPAPGGAGPTTPPPTAAAPSASESPSGSPSQSSPPPTAAGAPPTGAKATSRPNRGAGALPTADGAGRRAGPGANGANANGATPSPPGGEPLPPPEVPEIVKEYQRTFGGQILPLPPGEPPSPGKTAGA